MSQTPTQPTQDDINALLHKEQLRLQQQTHQKQQSWNLWKRINPGYDATQEPKQSIQKDHHVKFPEKYLEKKDITHHLKKDKYSEFVEARARFALLNGGGAAGGEKK